MKSVAAKRSNEDNGKSG